MSGSNLNKYVNLTDRHSLLGHALTDFARAFGKFEGEGQRNFAALYHEKIVTLYARQISEPLSEAWSKLPKASALVSAAKEGLGLSEAKLNLDTLDRLDKSIRLVFEQAVPSLRELSLNKTVRTDTLQSLTGNLMSLRDEAVENLKVNGDGIFSKFTRRITDRKAADLHSNYFLAVQDGTVADALSFTARELCRAALTDGVDAPLLDEIEVLAATIERKVPAHAHATLSRLNDIGNFISVQSNARYKFA